MEISKQNSNFYTSVEDALYNIDSQWYEYDGLLITGSHSISATDAEEDMSALRLARENKRPTLGICMGMQLMAVEYARNVLGYKEANTTELNRDTEHPVVRALPNLRVGIFPVEWRGQTRMESHWHNYALNWNYYGEFAKTWTLSHSRNDSLYGQVVEVMELRDAPFYVGIQFHPEYGSRKGKPHPLLLEFILACKRYTQDGPHH